MFRRLFALIAGTATAGTPLPGTAPPLTPDAKAIYPYVVPKEYLQYDSSQPNGLDRVLGHDLHIVLVQDLDGMVRNVRPEDVAKLGLTPEQAHKRADENLGLLVKSQTVKSTMFPSGPHGKPFVLFGGHWTAATASTWTGLYAGMSKALGAERLVVSIPHRDAMLVFAEGDAAYIAAMQAMIKEKEADGRKSLTWELFNLSKEGLTIRKP